MIEHMSQRASSRNASDGIANRKSVRAALGAAIAAVAAVFAALHPAAVRGEEAVFLQSGEQYQCKVEATEGDALRVTRKGETSTIPLDQIQRIEFEKAREFDGLDTPEALSAASPVFADALAVKTDDLKKKYPQAGHVVLSSETLLKINPDGTYTSESTRAWRILDQRASDTSFQALYFFPAFERVSILYGITVGPNGEVERVSDSAMKLEAVYPSYPEYNHQQRLRFAMKNPVPGATLFLKTRTDSKATDLLPATIDSTFWSDDPALERVVRIEADEATMKKLGIATTGAVTSEKPGVWIVKDTPQIFSEPMMPPMNSFAPRLLTAYPVAPWETLAKEFAARIDPKPVQSPAGTTAKDAYNKVRRDIRLVSVPQDALPVPPAAPDVVLKRGYGTETEKALLLEALLKGLNAKASTVLVRGRSLGDLLPDVPRIDAFNHALVRLDNRDGSATWLQPTLLKRGFGELGPDVQGGKGLDLRTGAIIDVPVLPLGADNTTRSVEVAIAPDGSAVVRDTLTATGNDAFALRGLGDLTDEELQTWAAQYVGSTLPGVSLVSFTHSDFDRINPQEKLSFTYKAPDLAESSGDFLVLRLPNARYSPSDVGRSTHQYDLFWLGRDSEDITFTVHAPAGYQAYAIGSGTENKGDGWSLTSTYATPRGEPGTVVFSERWRRETLDAPSEVYKAYREALITRGVLREETIVFQRLPGQPAAPAPVAAGKGAQPMNIDSIRGKGAKRTPQATQRRSRSTIPAKGAWNRPGSPTGKPGAMPNVKPSLPSGRNH